MNRQPLNFRFIFGAVAGILVVGFLILRGFVLPLQKANRDLTSLQFELADKRKEEFQFFKERRKLDRYRLLGMPRNLKQGVADYSRYLKDMFSEAGLAVEDFRGPTALETKVAPVTAGKKAGHMAHSYQVRAAGDWAGIVAFLESFERAPLLHRLKNFSIDFRNAKDRETLSFAMTIETLMVNKTERPDNLFGVDPRLVVVDTLLGLHQQPNAWALLLRGQAFMYPELPARKYADLVKVNPFLGTQPPPPPPPVAKKEPPPPPGIDVRPFIRLVLVEPEDQKATLHNRLAPLTISEKNRFAPRPYITLATKKGYNTFQVWDEERRQVQVRGEVIRVDQRDVYFQVGERVYGIHLGQSLAEAMRTPLSEEELFDLGLLESTEP